MAWRRSRSSGELGGTLRWIETTTRRLNIKTSTKSPTEVATPATDVQWADATIDSRAEQYAIRLILIRYPILFTWFHSLDNSTIKPDRFPWYKGTDCHVDGKLVTGLLVSSHYGRWRFVVLISANIKRLKM